MTKNLNRQPEFKLAEKDGRLGYYDTLTPLYAAFHEDDQTFSLMWTEYSDELDIFYRRYLEYQQLYGAQHGILAQSACLLPENAYTVSCIPWVPFKHFAVHSYENRSYYFPSVEAKEFYPAGDRLKMPLSLTCHHAAVDGYHVKCFWRICKLIWTVWSRSLYRSYKRKMQKETRQSRVSFWCLVGDSNPGPIA